MKPEPCPVEGCCKFMRETDHICYSCWLKLKPGFRMAVTNAIGQQDRGEAILFAIRFLAPRLRGFRSLSGEVWDNRQRMIDLGALYDPDMHCWRVPAPKLAEAQALIEPDAGRLQLV